MNWKLLVFSFFVIGAISILTYIGKVSLDVGIILSILSLFVPNLVDYFLKPKVALQIKNLEFVKKSYDNVEGYQLKGLITNNGKRISLNLDATFKIENAQHKSPNLLHVIFDTTDAQVRVKSREEPMRNIGYAWTDEKDQTIIGSLKELRQKDFVGLLFPYEEVSAGISPIFGSVSAIYSETYLKLEPNACYEVVVEIKGEDSEKNTVMRSKTTKIRPH